MNPEQGRRFGPYEIQSRLGGGGMGYVYRAWDARLHREVAIKLLNHEYTMPGMRERFLREARAASGLNHPNICTIFDIGEQDGDPYLVMELLEGETLKDRILGRTLQVDEIITIARETAEALGAAHAKGVVHRDVKPANIFLVNKANGGSQAKVLDFGLAKIEGGSLGAGSRSLDLTTVGATVGTLAYMSPEQARGEVLDSRSDLFSLGVVMYEMATRQVPFRGATSALVFVQLLNHPPEPVREWNDSIPRDLEKIILKLLAKERTARFQTAHELEVALIALTEKSSGTGWLRKAVSAVPLVRVPDPIAREKRLSRPKNASSSAAIVPSRNPTPVQAPVDGSRPASEQILRPVARLPRSGTTPDPSRLSTANPEHGVTSRFSPVAGSAPRRRAGDPVVVPEVVTVLPSHTEPEESGSRHDGASQNQSVHMLEPAPLEPTLGPPRRPSGAVFPWDNEAEHDVTPFPRLLEEDEPRSFRVPFRPLWLGLGATVVIASAVLVFILVNRGRFTSKLLTPDDAVVIAQIENETGDRLLDNSVGEGLRIALAQSPWLYLRGDDAYRAAHRLISPDRPDQPERNPLFLARKTAERLGAKAYVVGSISGTSAPYLLHVDLREVSSNDVIASAEARAESLQQVPAAIDRVAGDLRSNLGEDRASVDQSSIPLAKEGSANLAALQLFSDAEGLIASHQPLAAIAELQQAVSIDPHYIQAYLQLSSLYHQLRAETSAAEAAHLALSASDGAAERTRGIAQAVYEIESTGDYLRATSILRRLTTRFSHDSVILSTLAETLVFEGRMTEALQIAQQSYADNPFNAAAYSDAESALIGLDHYDAAFQLDMQAQRLGVARSADSLTAAYLDGREQIVEEIAANIPVGTIEYRPDWSYGIYLDNGGHLAAGATHWHSRAEAAEENEGLKSAATFLLAQGALDRALLGDCNAALGMLHSAEAVTGVPAGRSALFHMGLSSALCGETPRAEEFLAELQQQYPQSFDVKGFYLADIQAAIALRKHEPTEALEILKAARPYDLISLTPFLRGQAHVNRGEVEIGIVDLQTVLSHRGVTFLVGSDVYPAAEIAVARAFADSGDVGNSAAAYRRFIDLWRTADPLNPLVLEAQLHAGN